MLWEDYYDKLGDWATSTAVSRMSKLETFGPPDEIIDAINQIGFNDEKGATRLLKKAVAASVKFTGEQLADIFLICDEEVINRAVQLSSDQFSTEDLDALYGFSDDYDLIEIANKRKICLPASLKEYARSLNYILSGDKAFISAEELAAEYDYISESLSAAHGHLKNAYKLSMADISLKKGAVTIKKYYYIHEAQSHISNALNAWNMLEDPRKKENLLAGVWPDIGDSSLLSNYFFDGIFTNLTVKQRIRKSLKNIEYAIHEIQKLRNYR